MIDGILIWVHKPSPKDCVDAGCSSGKFLCGRKKKSGLNCQAVCDVWGRILDILIIYPGSTSDCLSQLRIRIKCTFGMLTHRWAILRSAIPMNVTIQKTVAPVLSLAKLHNFCINADDRNSDTYTASDEWLNELNGAVPLVTTTQDLQSRHEEVIPEQLLHGGHHFDDIGVLSVSTTGSAAT